MTSLPVYNIIGNMKLIEVWRTSMRGTYSSGKYRAKTKREAIKKAKLKFKDEAKYWDFYCPEYQFKKK